jgi:hypothetical protein
MALEFVIDIKDLVSGPSRAMSKAIFGLSTEMKVLKSAITTTENAMTKAKSIGDTQKFEALRVKLEGYKSALEEASTGTSNFKERLAGMAEGMQLVAQAAGTAFAAFGGLVIEGAKFAIEASEAKTAALSLWSALGEGLTTGAQVDDLLDEMRGKIGLTKDAMTPWANQLMTMGIRELPQLEEGLKAAASAAALVAGGGDAYISLSKKIQAADDASQPLKIKLKELVGIGLNVTDVAMQMGISAKALGDGLKHGTINADKFGAAINDALVAKGAGPLETMSLSVKNLGGLFKEYIADMFEDMGPAIRPFLIQIKDLFAIFSQSKPSGEAMKAGIGGFFTNLFAMLPKLVLMSKHFFLDMAIYALKAYIALKPIGAWFIVLSKNTMVTKGITTALKTFAIALGLAVVLIGGAIAAIVGLGVAISTFIAIAINAGAEFINGLVAGIISGTDTVVNAVTGLAGKAKDAFKNALGIHSPSKVMMQMGVFAGQGVALGLKSTEPQVSSASASVAQATAGAGTAAPKAASPAASGGGGNGATFNFAAGAFVIDGAGKSAEGITEAMISLVFERIALSQGLGAT